MDEKIMPVVKTESDASRQDLGYLLLLVLMFFAYEAGRIAWVVMDTTPPLPDQSNILIQSLYHYVLLTERPLHEALLSIATGYHYYPPLVPFTAALTYLVFGTGADAALFAMFPFVAFLFWSIFAMGNRLGRARAGVLAAFLTATSPMVIQLSREFWLDLPLTAMVIGAIYFLIQSKCFKHTGYSICLGIVCGLGMLTKWTFAFYMVGPFVLVFWQLYKETWPSVNDRLVAGVASALVISAVSALGILGYGLLDGEARVFVKVSLFGVAIIAGVVTTPSILIWLGALVHPNMFARLNSGIALSWLNLLRVTILTLIVSGPWYLNSIGRLLSDFHKFGVDAAGVEGDPLSLSLPWLLYYLWNLLNSQLFLPYGVLVLCGVVWAMGTRHAHRECALIVACLTMMYFVLTVIPNKATRFSLPMVPMLLVLASVWICTRRPLLRASLHTVVILVGFLQYASVAYGYSFAERTVSIPLPHMQVTEYRSVPPQIVIYSDAARMYLDLDAFHSHPPLSQHWPLESVLEMVSSDSVGREAVLVVAIHERFFNYYNLRYFSKLKQWPGQVKHPRFAGFQADPEKWEGTHYLLARPNDRIVKEIQTDVSKQFVFLEVDTIQTLRLPDDSLVRLWRIRARDRSTSPE